MRAPRTRAECRGRGSCGERTAVTRDPPRGVQGAAFPVSLPIASQFCKCPRCGVVPVARVMGCRWQNRRSRLDVADEEPSSGCRPTVWHADTCKTGCRFVPAQKMPLRCLPRALTRGSLAPPCASALVSPDVPMPPAPARQRPAGRTLLASSPRGAWHPRVFLRPGGYFASARALFTAAMMPSLVRVAPATTSTSVDCASTMACGI